MLSNSQLNGKGNCCTLGKRDCRSNKQKARETAVFANVLDSTLGSIKKAKCLPMLVYSEAIPILINVAYSQVSVNKVTLNMCTMYLTGFSRAYIYLNPSRLLQIFRMRDPNKWKASQAIAKPVLEI